MSRHLNDPIYVELRRLLVEGREATELTQVQVAEKLGRAQSFVSKYEQGERRLDVVDFLLICEVLRLDPRQVLDDVWRRKGR